MQKRKSNRRPLELPTRIRLTIWYGTQVVIGKSVSMNLCKVLSFFCYIELNLYGYKHDFIAINAEMGRMSKNKNATKHFFSFSMVWSSN